VPLIDGNDVIQKVPPTTSHPALRNSVLPRAAERSPNRAGGGPVGRFRRSKQVASYLGLNPGEHSSGGRQRLGAISKQGNTLVRWLLLEAAQHAARFDPQLRQDYQRLKFRRGSAVAKVAIARKLAVRMYWMLRSGADYARLVRTQGSPGATLVSSTTPLG